MPTRRPCRPFTRPKGRRVGPAVRAPASQPGVGPRASAVGAIGGRRGEISDLVATAPGAPSRCSTSTPERVATVPRAPSPRVRGDQPAEPRATAGRAEPKARRRTATGTPRGGDGRRRRPTFSGTGVSAMAIRQGAGVATWSGAPRRSAPTYGDDGCRAATSGWVRTTRPARLSVFTRP